MLSLSSVNVEIAGIQILRDITFELKPGLTTVLIGRNGAGKTTLLRTIMGLLPLKSGSLSLGGADLAAEPAFARAGHGIGYAPEDRRLIPEFSVEDNITLPALALKLPAAETRRRLDEVYTLLPELQAMRKRPGGGVSGGQGKMVALGRALMVAEKVLMLDEPFQGLAPALALEYARTLDRLRKEKPSLALFVTESSPNLLQKITDVMLRIERGSIENS
ncbi:ATP-binding cassette domain-containing protein [Rhizobiaceae bacterium BDR2-2]|uniref:ATP-binding cassette domain-containing protein n=1 Tax=Ectorhizobium quercum TaxID=2965071 RepID=A0AAE3N1P3_9HYPH|nr:ATP-binding cassette domain-containing protein [Ectorhizobium quercum]MCX8997112.1 ATP-binding cassette domain-containing protein [Ectorhizobium quercum]